MPVFRKPDYPEDEWSDEQKQHARSWDGQTRLLKKLQDIAVDAQEYYNDHGEDALFVGFPMISLPPSGDQNGVNKSRILAPAAFIPVKLSVQKKTRPGASIAAAGDGSDLLIPNPALLAWLEQQTGEELPELFEDDTGDEPEREYREILRFIVKSLGMSEEQLIDFACQLKAIPKAEDLPDKPAVLPSAILGLFPLTNPGLLRDTKWMIEQESRLKGPIRSYLHKEALEFHEGDVPEAEEAVSETSFSKASPNFEEDNFIAPIDPCQTNTAITARTSKALVIHGPPGTGKSQTITNIVGDHLARGQRVLFVCDKRTALDVVKFRMDHVGLGQFCGIIHDPTRDRRNLYMGLRDRLEQLTSEPPCQNPNREL
ncbi:MAG: DUF4011 domain-containing protein, partial [Verrucomicrobiae bacterium]|nr:DUF4011 domain-containing protein [Verrucomicrobiae bacterium]